MTVVTGAQWTGMIVTKDATGALAAAGVGPVGVLYVNGVANAAVVTIAGANPYSWTVTLPALANGDCVSMYITATVAAIATASVVAEDTASTVYVSSRGTANAGDAMALTVGERTTLAGVIWANAVRTLTSFGTLVADITTAISAILCNVWACSSRTLTMSLAAVKSMLLGSKLELWRGDTLAQTFTGLGDLTGIADLWFTVKKQDLNDADSAAEIQISQTGGLLVIAGATATVPANGSITINLPATQGSITVNLAAVEMAKLDIDFTGYWDIQKLTGTTVQTITRGNASVLGDVTRRIV